MYFPRVSVDSVHARVVFLTCNREIQFRTWSTRVIEEAGERVCDPPQISVRMPRGDSSTFNGEGSAGAVSERTPVTGKYRRSCTDMQFLT